MHSSSQQLRFAAILLPRPLNQLAARQCRAATSNCGRPATCGRVFRCVLLLRFWLWPMLGNWTLVIGAATSLCRCPFTQAHQQPPKVPPGGGIGAWRRTGRRRHNPKGVARCHPRWHGSQGPLPFYALKPANTGESSSTLTSSTTSAAELPSSADANLSINRKTRPRRGGLVRHTTSGRRSCTPID